MNIGKLNERIQFQRPSSEQDDYGEVNAPKTYTPYASRWANIVTNNSQEVLSGSKPEGKTVHTVTIRYFDEVQLNDIIIWGEKTLHISGIKGLDGRKVWQELTCIEIVRPIDLNIVEAQGQYFGVYFQ